jgi:hypothetical protein
MYLLCAEVAKNCIRKHSKTYRLNLNVEELAHDTATYVINKYMENAKFKLDPMTGYIFLASKGIMFKDKNWNKRKVSFEDWMEERLGVEA